MVPRPHLRLSPASYTRSLGVSPASPPCALGSIFASTSLINQAALPVQVLILHRNHRARRPAIGRLHARHSRETMGYILALSPGRVARTALKRHATSDQDEGASALGVWHGSPLRIRLFAASTYELQLALLKCNCNYVGRPTSPLEREASVRSQAAPLQSVGHSTTVWYLGPPATVCRS